MEHGRYGRRDVRVLHVLNRLRASGAEVMLHAAAGQWKHHGIEVDVLAVGPEPGPFAADLRSVGYTVVHEPDGLLFRVPPRLARRVRDGGYDVVHVHTERAGFYFGLAALSAGAGVLRTVHSVFGFGGMLRIQRKLQRQVLRRMGVVHVGVSHGVADNEKRRFGNPSQVIENWCGKEFTPPTKRQQDQARQALKLHDHDFVVVSVGNCAPVKRHEAILEAVAHISGLSDLVYLHVGDEDGTGKERRLAEQLGISRQVHFLGHRRPLQALHAADVFVMTSAYEGLGLAAVEALMTGLPLVLADVPGLRDVAEASPAAWLTDTGPAQLAAAIERAADFCKSRPRMDAARSFGDRFSLQRGVANYAEIYHQLARSSSAHGHGSCVDGMS
ncbi:glycosyltransferase [Streptomyces sp. NBC_00996]|uniref:glycosyltransferase n=1 Tax=Streptomyces sp. NBC_00996 TaxID=2903710 RepID=UPI00386A7EF6|nr:glycosyltransferase [Streptomyces sp. NBC_00996]